MTCEVWRLKNTHTMCGTLIYCDKTRAARERAGRYGCTCGGNDMITIVLLCLVVLSILEPKKEVGLVFLFEYDIHIYFLVYIYS